MISGGVLIVKSCLLSPPIWRFKSALEPMLAAEIYNVAFREARWIKGGYASDLIQDNQDERPEIQVFRVDILLKPCSSYAPVSRGLLWPLSSSTACVECGRLPPMICSSNKL